MSPFRPYDDDTGEAMVAHYNAAREGKVKPTKYVPPGARPDADPLRKAARVLMGQEAPAAPESAYDADSPIREEAWARMTPAERDGAIKRDPAAEARYAELHDEVEAEKTDEYMNSPTGGAWQNAKKLWAESRR